MAELTERDKQFVADMLDWFRQTLGADTNRKFANSDWTLIVSLHALLESALNAALVAEIGRPELARLIGKLDTIGSPTSKFAFAKRLGILTEGDGRFIQKLSELRNLCVHDISNFSFNLIQHLGSLEKGERNAVINAYMNQVKADANVSCPQEGLMIATMNIISQLRVHHLRCENRDLETEIVRRKAARLDEQNQSTPTKE
jgi:hypothetical protein